ncbi:MAG: hypothetical protein HY882_01775 [Deltaproteobacteria bacterium]|nr:hypothetical protein [Deltaproteobacteria bacterium]
MTAEISVSAQKLALARELLDDIELGRLALENLLLKTTRLARMIGDQETQEWLECELSGFIPDDPVSLKYMMITGRWLDQAKNQGYWQSLTQIDAQITMNKLQIQQLQVPNIVFVPSRSSAPEEFSESLEHFKKAATSPINRVLEHLKILNAEVARLSGIRAKILAQLHAFISKAYYELAFGNLQETIFERQRKLVDARLAESCGSVLEEFQAIYDRLIHGAPEAISQALSICRRFMNAFADSIYPPTNETIRIDGNELPLTAKHPLNRLLVFIHKNCESPSRRQRLQHTLNDLYDHVTSGATAQITPDEARFLFLRTYIILGEILSLKEGKTGKPEDER